MIYLCIAVTAGILIGWYYLSQIRDLLIALVRKNK